MSDKLIYLKLTLLGFVSFVLEQFGAFGILACIMIVLFVVDWAVGLVAAISENTIGSVKHGWKSIIGARGIIKKIGYGVAVGVACLVDLIVHVATDFFNVSLPISMFFATVTCMWFVFNEMISILENIERTGAELPAWLLDLIKLLQININKEVEDKIKDLQD